MKVTETWVARAIERQSRDFPEMEWNISKIPADWEEALNMCINGETAGYVPPEWACEDDFWDWRESPDCKKFLAPKE